MTARACMTLSRPSSVKSLYSVPECSDRLSTRLSQRRCPRGGRRTDNFEFATSRTAVTLADLYGALSVRHDATTLEIREAYRRLILLAHPDRTGAASSPKDAVGLNVAYETLSDPARRQAYDRQLAQQRRALAQLWDHLTLRRAAYTRPQCAGGRPVGVRGAGRRLGAVHARLPLRRNVRGDRRSARGGRRRGCAGVRRVLGAGRGSLRGGAGWAGVSLDTWRAAWAALRNARYRTGKKPSVSHEVRHGAEQRLIASSSQRASLSPSFSHAYTSLDALLNHVRMLRSRAI